MRKYRKSNKGFTLIELVIVVAVLAILVGLLAPSYTKYVKKSKVTKCEAQRAEIERVYQIACIEDSTLDSIKDTNGNNDLIIKRLVELGLLDTKEPKCPVYNQDYKFVVSTDKNNKRMFEAQCPCVNNLLDYIGTANNIYSDKYDKLSSYRREDLIKDFYEKRGSLMEVDSNMKSNTNFSNETLYWRPYTMKDGKVVLFGSKENNETHANWKAYLIYVDGKIYQCTQKSGNGTPDGSSISNLFKYEGGEFQKWLEESSDGQKFELVSK